MKKRNILKRIIAMATVISVVFSSFAAQPLITEAEEQGGVITNQNFSKYADRLGGTPNDYSDEAVQARLELAEELGLQDSVNANGYLVESFFIEKSIADFAEMGVAPLIESSIGKQTSPLARGVITEYEKVTEVWNGWTFSVTYYEVDGYPAFCCQVSKNNPSAGDPTDPPMEITESVFRKIMYYGNLGPADMGIASWMWTLLCVSYANGDNGYGIYPGVTEEIERLIAIFEAQPEPPEWYTVWKVHTRTNYQDLMYAMGEQPDEGYLELEKSSSNEDISNGNPNYSLAGAVYGVYDSSGTEVGRLTTDEYGKTNRLTLDSGDYTIKEITAPLGYAVDLTTYNVVVLKGELVTKEVSDIPKNNPIGLVLEKTDSETGEGTAQGGASLAGAEFTLKFYGELSDTDPADAGHTPLRTWVLRTDADGKAFLTSEYLVSGDPLYLSSDGTPAMPIGTITVQETKAPTGYKLNSTVYVTKITEGGTIEIIDIYQDADVEEEIIRGGVEVEKWDQNLDENTPQGDTSLAGAEFEIINRSNGAVIVNGTSYAKDAVVMTITTDANGYASTGARDLPYGQYELKEKTPPSGYTPGGVTSRTFNITEDGVVVSLRTTETAIKNVPIQGDVKVAKWDNDLNEQNPQGNATLEGAVITITNISDHPVLVDGVLYQVGDVVVTLTTDADGNASTSGGLLPYGTYKAEETFAPDGYLSSGKIDETFQIRTNGEVVDLSTDDRAIKNDIKRGGVEIEKWDSEANASDTPQGDATLEGAVFEIINRSTNAVEVKGVVYQPGEVVMTLTTDANGFAATGNRDLPFGDYEIREATPPNGYKPEGTLSRTFTIRVDGAIVSMKSDGTAIKNVPIRGDVILAKWDNELNEQTPQGAATLEGAVFTITNISSHPVLVDDVWYEVGEVVAVLITDADGNAGTTGKLLPYGTYRVDETKAPEGYLQSGKLNQTFVIRTDGEVVNLNSDEAAIKNDLLRGDIEGIKAGETANNRLANIPFEIVSQTTGESHVIVTDENGYFSTASSHNPHSRNTNRGETSEDGVWFGDIKALDDDLGALPYDTYDFIELRCDNNAEYVLIEMEFTISRDSHVLDLGTLINYKTRIPEIDSDVRDPETDSKESYPNKEMKFYDTISYTGLEEGETYTVKGVLMDKDTGEALVINGQQVTGEVTFTAEKSFGSVDVEFVFNGLVYTGQNLVCFQKLYDSKGNEVASHEDLEDEDQTITMRYPSVRTLATDKDTGVQYSYALDEVTIIDTVYYEDVIANKVHVLKGVLMDKATGNPVISDGKEVEAERVFVTTGNSGTVTMEFTFDASALKGNVTVVYERLYYEDRLIAVHEDINDVDQTIEFKDPEIGTKATNEETGSQWAESKNPVTIIDTVSYNGLIPGLEYTVKGVLMDKATGEKLIVNGDYVTAERTFTATDEVGTIDITFTFDASDLEGVSVVVFEKLFFMESEIADHEDIDDPDQTIEFDKPVIGTQAREQESGSQLTEVKNPITIVDTVRYDGLEKGVEYTLKGVLMDKATGEKLLIDGKEVTGETVFTPTTTAGTIDVTFTFDATGLEGKTIVVFEKLYAGSTEVTSHENINDEGQSIHFKDKDPVIGTKARDKDSGTQVAESKNPVTIIDTVSYENLIPNLTYTLTGVLMDQESGLPILVNGEEVTATRTFIPTTANGTVDVTFTFDATLLAGVTTVVFEKLFLDGEEIANHEDIDDPDQTIVFPPDEPEIGTKATNPEDGSQLLDPKNPVSIKDTVSYTGLTPGKEYTIKGVLMDKSTGEALLVDGETVTSEVTFTPTEKNGTVDLTFTFDASKLAGAVIVVFEKLYLDLDVVAEHEDIDDPDQTVSVKPRIGTQARNAEDGTQKIPAENPVTIIDKVMYEGLIPGEEYTMRGTLMDKETGEPLLVGGKTIVVETVFVPTEKNGYVEIEFTFDATGLEGKTLVVFEKLFRDRDGDGEPDEEANHEDIEDPDQTIEVPPTIATKAENVEDGSQLLDPKNPVTIKDTVSYKGLKPGQEYTIKGVLMDKSTGEALLVDGETVTSEVTFTPTEKDGSVELFFTFDASKLEGAVIVVFEKLYLDLDVIAEHEDIDDPDQTVSVKPRIGTQARNAEDGTQKIPAENPVTIIDKVMYEGLIPGEVYTMRGVLMDKETGEPLLIGGEEIVVEKVFIPTEKNGYIEIEFTFDATGLEGKTLVVFEKLFRDRDGDGDPDEEANHEDIEDPDQTIEVPPTIATKAENVENGLQQLDPKNPVTIKDTVSYKGLKPGQEYTIKGVLMDKSTGEALLVDGETVTSEVTFTPTEKDGSVELFFTFDASKLAGAVIVVFEKLYLDLDVIAEHEDIDDPDQTVTVKPKIGTQARNAEDGTQEIPAGNPVTIIDKVMYEGLIPGEVYTMRGILMDKATGEPLLVNGEEVVVEKVFTPEEPNGYVEIEFTFDSSALAGKTLVVFEKLFRDVDGDGEPDEEANHEDIEDPDQTVYVKVKIGTLAYNKEDGTHAIDAKNPVTIIDKVMYEGLIPGKEYTMRGTLMDKSTGEPLVINGETIVIEKTFVPEEPNGYIEIEFTIDASGLAGKTIVVYEKLFGDKDGDGEPDEEANHEDINDPDQSIFVNSNLRTKARHKGDELQEVEATNPVTIVDTVTYKGLIPGKEYVMKGTLMDKATGQQILIDGEAVTSEIKFIPETADGEVQIEFTFDATGFAGATIVVFEKLFLDGEEVGNHEDINDPDQCIFVKPIIGTKATNKEDGTQRITAKNPVTILDTVSYEGLVPGREYTMSGILMNKSTNAPLLVNGQQIKAEKVFVPTEAKGTVEIEFTFDATGLAGTIIVVFEKVFYEGEEIGQHEDINDAGQTVTVVRRTTVTTPPTTTTTTTTPRTTASVFTGDNSLIILFISLAFISLSAGGFLVYRRRKKTDK